MNRPVSRVFSGTSGRMLCDAGKRAYKFIAGFDDNAALGILTLRKTVLKRQDVRQDEHISCIIEASAGADQ